MVDPCLLHRWNGVDWGCCPACRAVTWLCTGAFLEVFGQPPQRHRSRRLYSESELAKVMAHLGHEGSRAAHPEVQR